MSNVFKFSGKLLLKIALFPIVLILQAVCMLAELIVHLSTYVISPVVLFVLVFFIYSLATTHWQNAAILGCVEVGMVALVFGAMWIVDTGKELVGTFTAWIYW